MAYVSEDFTVTCGSHPVQIEGRLTDGRWFYFRARGDAVQLGASDVGPDEAVAASIEVGRFWPEQAPGQFVRQYGSDAGLLTVPQAHRLLMKMAAELPDREATV